jgi:hypothetical protein
MRLETFVVVFLAPAFAYGADTAAETPRDVSEPPFAGDFTWMNGSNYQPEPLLKLGPLVGTLYVDTYFLWSGAQPSDHTAFPSSAAPRHNEAGLNLASIGFELQPNAIDTPQGSPIGQFSMQYGSDTETVAGADPTFSRGFFLSKSGFLPIRTASAGWHFHAWHGINVEAGILPSYVGMESYLTQENWNYLHSFVGDFVPFYMSGARATAYPTDKLKLELWAVNGWQSFGQWHEAGAGGYLVSWRPSDRFSITNDGYAGQDAPKDDKSFRLYSDTSAQLQYFRRSSGPVRSLAVSFIGDFGYEYLSNGVPHGWRTGYALAHRIGFARNFFFALRGDIFWDEGQVLVPVPPGPVNRPDTTTTFLGGGITTTLDYRPSPWLVVRLEYMHREANIPLFSGPDGVSAPGPINFLHYDNRAVLNVTLRL